MTEPTVLAIPFFILSLAIEAWVLHREGRGYDPADAMASISGGLGSLLTMALMKGAALVAFGFVLINHHLTLRNHQTLFACSS